MWAAGYSFFLLNNIFTSHWGFQKSSSRPSWRMKQMSLNSLKFSKFKKEVRLGISCNLHYGNLTHILLCRYQRAIIINQPQM